jgi:hypothetical protein
LNGRFKACLDAESIDPLKVVVIVAILVPGVSYAAIADPVNGGWAILYISFLYLSILLLKDKPPIWATLIIALTLFATNLVVVYHIPTKKMIYPFLIIEEHPLEHPPVEGVYKVSYVDVSQVFLLIEAIRIYMRCSEAKASNNFKPDLNESNNTPEAAVV